MKIVYLITGSGGSFYCGNCYRDMIYLRAIKRLKGVTAAAIPLYLPPDSSSAASEVDKNVFFGAISLYLREKVSIFRNMPAFLEKFFDSSLFLKLAAKNAGSTRTEGLEDMTISMIQGENAFPKKEIDRLVEYLTKEGKPDIIHLSNALIIGLAHHLKKRLNVKIVCSLLNEDDWIDEMAEPFRSDAWKLIAKEACFVDAFITPSQYYKDFFISRTGISGQNIHMVPLGFDTIGSVVLEKKDNYPALGYLCRLNSMNGFDKVVDAFIILKKDGRLPGLTLHVSGGFTGDDKAFIRKQIQKINKNGLKHDIRIYPEFDGTKKDEFFRNIDIMSVPVRKYDGYGLYLLEANASGIPVVQPATGGFPEIIERSGGGIVYSPDSVEELANTLFMIFENHDLRKELAAKGRENVKNLFSLAKMAEGLSLAYETALSR